MSLMRPVLPAPGARSMGQVFPAQAVAQGGVMRRSLHWIERQIGRAACAREGHRRN